MARRSPVEAAAEVINDPPHDPSSGEHAAFSTPTPQRASPPLPKTPSSKPRRPHTPKSRSLPGTPLQSRSRARRSQGASGDGVPAPSSDGLHPYSLDQLKQNREAKPIQCPICMHRWKPRAGDGWLKKHVKDEIVLWQDFFYDMDGVEPLQSKDVKHHGCGICSQKAPWDTIEELVDHVVDCHCAYKRPILQSQESSGVGESNTAPPIPAKMTWDFSTVFESLLKHDRLKIEAYRPSKHVDAVVAFLWPRTKETLQIFKALQEGSWLREDDSAIQELVGKACKLATHEIRRSSTKR